MTHRFSPLSKVTDGFFISITILIYHFFAPKVKKVTRQVKLQKRLGREKERTCIEFITETTGLHTQFLYEK